MKTVIMSAIICGILLAAGIGSISNVFSDGRLVVIAILVGSSAIIAVKDRRRHAWH